MAAQSGKQYELKEVVLRLAEGRSLYSDQAISNADAAVDVMRKELMQQDREVVYHKKCNLFRSGVHDPSSYASKR